MQAVERSIYSQIPSQHEVRLPVRLPLADVLEHVSLFWSFIFFFSPKGRVKLTWRSCGTGFCSSVHDLSLSWEFKCGSEEVTLWKDWPLSRNSPAYTAL